MLIGPHLAAKEVYDLRKFITTNIENITNATINKNEYKEELIQLNNENTILKRDFKSKEEFINMLLEKICDNSYSTVEKCKQTHFDNNIPNINSQQINSKNVTLRKTQKNLDIPKIR